MHSVYEKKTIYSDIWGEMILFNSTIFAEIAEKPILDVVSNI